MKLLESAVRDFGIGLVCVGQERCGESRKPKISNFALAYAFERINHGLCAVFHAKFTQDGCNVILYSLMADSMKRSNFFIAFAFHDQV